MRKNMIIFVFASLIAAEGTAAELLCGKETNTVEETQCLSAELRKYEQILAGYLDAAKLQIAKEDLGKPQLDAAQEAWIQYRSLECGDVYIYQAKGTYRYRAELDCEIRLTLARTHEIWSAYLKKFGQTFPLHPEPDLK